MLEILKKMLGDPVTTENIISLFGDTQTGKSTIALQIAHEIAQTTKRPALIYDTEGGLIDTINAFAYSPKVLHLRTQTELPRIIYDHGTDVSIVVKGNLHVHRNAIMGTSPMMELCKQKKYSCIVYDSYSVPFFLFGTELENLPARKDAHWLWNREIVKIQRAINCCIIQIHHASFPVLQDPNGPPPQPIPIGGKGLQYASKYMIQFEKAVNSDNRIISVYRHPKYAPYALRDVLQLTERGFTTLNTK